MNLEVLQQSTFFSIITSSLKNSLILPQLDILNISFSLVVSYFMNLKNRNDLLRVERREVSPPLSSHLIVNLCIDFLNKIIHWELPYFSLHNPILFYFFLISKYLKVTTVSFLFYFFSQFKCRSMCNEVINQRKSSNSKFAYLFMLLLLKAFVVISRE